MELMNVIKRFYTNSTFSRRSWVRLIGSLNFVTQILSQSRHLLQPLLRPQLLGSTSTRDLEECSHPLDEPLNTQAKRNLLCRSQSRSPMDRCIPNRMGRTHKFFLCNRILQSNRDETAHKHSRDKTSLPHLSTTQSEEQDNPFIHRQCTSAMRNKQAVMQISESPKRDSNPYSNSPDEKLKNQSISHLDYTQLESTCSQSHSTSPNKMGATYENIQRNNTPPRTSADRPDGVKQRLQS